MRLALAALLALSIGLITANEQDSLKTYDLPAVRVISYLPGQSIGSLEIKAVETGEDALALSIRDILEDIPGLNTSAGSKDESSIRIRGFRKNEVKILIDGRPLNSGYFGNVDLNNIPVSGLKDIQVIKGPGSAIYGSGTMGGIINLITEEPSDEGWVKLGLGIKRNNTQMLELTGSHGFEKWNYWLYGSRMHSDGFVLSRSFEPTAFENGGPRNNSGKTVYNTQGRIGFDLFDFHRIGLSASRTWQDEKPIPSSIYENRYRLYKDWARANASVMGDFVLGEDLSLATHLYYDYSADNYLEYNDATHQYLNTDSIMKSKIWGFNPRLIWSYHPDLLISTGARLEQSQNKRKDNGEYLQWTQSSVLNASAFVALDYGTDRDFSVNGSLGGVWYLPDNGTDGNWSLEPSIGMNWQLRENFSLSAAWGINSAAPTMRQLFSSSSGNPLLMPQKAIKTELGAKQQVFIASVPVSLGISAFNNQISNLIDRLGEQYQNIYNYSTFGMEFRLISQPLEFWETDLAYSWLAYQKKDGYLLTECPEHTWELEQSIKLPYQVRLKINTIYTGERFSQDSSYNYKILEPYWKTDLQLSRQWKKARLYGGIENVLDQDYQMEYGYPGAGLNFNLGLEYEI